MNNRQGVGFFFIIIVTLIVIVAFVAIFQMSFSQHVVGQVGDISIGQMALLLAESAASEASFNVRKEINKPGTETFKKFRYEVYGDDSGSFPLDINIHHTTKLLQKDQYKRFSIDELRVDVMLQKQFSTVPYEKTGMINCQATVSQRVSLTNSITRTVNLMLEFKVHLTGPPRPYDQVTFFLVNTTSVIQSANYKIDDTVSEYRRVSQERDQFVSLLESERGSVPDFNFDSAISRLNGVNIPSAESIENRIHKFDTPLTIFTVKNQVEVEKVDLPGRLEEADTEIKLAQQVYEDASSTLTANAANEMSVSAYVTALRGFVQAYDKNITVIDEFQDYFAEYSGTARDQLVAFFPKLNESEWRRKASWYLTDKKGDINKQLKSLLTEVSPLSGVIFIDNNEQPLSLEEIDTVNKGNLILVTKGNVRLTGNSTGPPSSLLTVISYGTISIDGSCYASIIANNRLSMASSAQIHGNLVIKDVRDFSGLSGIVKRDSRLHSGRTVPGDASGAYTDYYFVSVNPSPLKLIERN